MASQDCAEKGAYSHPIVESPIPLRCTLGARKKSNNAKDLGIQDADFHFLSLSSSWHASLNNAQLESQEAQESDFHTDLQ